MPGLHCVSTVDPAGQNEPIGQLVHCDSCDSRGVLEYVPSRQGSGAEAPASQYEPAVHAKHAVSPCSSWYLPASHPSHVGCCVLGCTMPGLQGVAAVEPVEQKLPTGQAVHCSSLASRVELLCRPAGHASSAAEPPGQ